MYELNRTAKANEISNIKDTWKINSTDSEERKKEKEEKILSETSYIDAHCIISINVEGGSGERFSIIPGDNSDLDDVFSEANLPFKISKIVFDNWSNYQIFQKRLLNFKIDVELQFKDKAIWNFQNGSSVEGNFIEVVGLEETWVLGAIEKIKRSMEKKSNLFSRFYYKFLNYNVVLWIIGIPGILLLLKYLSRYFTFLQDYPEGLPAIVFLSMALLFLIFFRALFNYLRWLFPYMEIVEQPKSAQALQRTIVAFLVLSVISGWVSLVVEFVVGLR